MNLGKDWLLSEICFSVFLRWKWIIAKDSSWRKSIFERNLLLDYNWGAHAKLIIKRICSFSLLGHHALKLLSRCTLDFSYKRFSVRSAFQLEVSAVSLRWKRSYVNGNFALKVNHREKCFLAKTDFCRFWSLSEKILVKGIEKFRVI